MFENITTAKVATIRRLVRSLQCSGSRRGSDRFDKTGCRQSIELQRSRFRRVRELDRLRPRVPRRAPRKRRRAAGFYLAVAPRNASNTIATPPLPTGRTTNRTS